MPSDVKKQETKEKPNEIDLLQIGEHDSNFPSPIDLNIRTAKEVELPSLKWYNAEEKPRLMKISNSGHSIIVTAKWFGPSRPYISGCQLPGNYIFSQAHFHWGRNDQEGSEHTTDGNRQPLELHVMYFKTDYGTPEKAMKELDGIIILAYLYNVRKQPNMGLVPIMDMLPKVVKPFTSSAIEVMPITQLAPAFTDDFYSYWGIVYAEINYKILWFIHREAQTITSQQLSLFREVLRASNEPLLSNFRDTKSINGRSVFLVNPGKTRDRTLIEAPPDPEVKGNTPPPEGKKSSKAKGKAKSAAGGPAARRKSAKRQSSARRKSKKESGKHQKTVEDKESFTERKGQSSRRGQLSFRHDESQVHHEPRVLITGVSFSMRDECLSSSCSSSNTISSSRSRCSDGKEECGFNMDGFEERCKFLLQQNQAKKDLPFVDISDLIGKVSINDKCEQLLSKLHTCSNSKKDTCLPILNDLEKYIKETIEKVKIENATKEGELNGHEDIVAIGEGTGFFNNGVKLIPPQTPQEEIATIRPPNKEFKTFKDFIGASEPDSFDKSTTQPMQSILCITSPPIATQQQYNTLITPVEWASIQKYECQEKQFAEICATTPADTREIIRVIITNKAEEESDATQKQVSQLQVSQGLEELTRNRIHSDGSVTQADSIHMEINNINQNLWNLPELLSNNAVLTGLLQQVTTHSPGVKFISNETMAVVTSQSSADDNNHTAEPSITQNVSYLASQNTIMEIDQSKSSSSGRFVGKKVNKLRRRRSSVKHFNVMSGAGLDKGLKRQTIITKIFQNSIPNQRTVRTANANSLATSTVTRNRQETPTPTVRVKKLSKKPVWKY